MNTTLSPQFRLVAVLGMLVIVVGAGMFMLGRQKQAPAPALPLPTHHAPATTVAAPRAAAKPTAEQHLVPKKAVRIRTHGLPLAVAKSLKRHRIVVVSLLTPGVDVDRMARDEAAAAASSTHAGFVSLNVFRQANGVPLLKKLGIVEAPAVLVVMRPARIFAQLEGFADRDTVVQAVANARR